MKRLDRLKQWAGEKMGGEVKTTVSDDFKSMEAEMELRHTGMEKLHGTMNNYIKSMSKRKEAEDREKMLPLDALSHAMIGHGEEFESDSTFGNCLIDIGHANEKIARIQDGYVSKASESWLESLERSLTQMKEYQAARKRLESRRLAYDTTLTKMQKQKREDFRVEEELRAQRIKYEESNEDVLRRMTDIQESEAQSLVDLSAFLEAELEYHDRCREVLYNLKRQWPMTAGQTGSPTPSRRVHSRTNTFIPREESPPPERLSIRSRINSQEDRFRMQTPEPSDFQKPILARMHTTPANFEGTQTQAASRRGLVTEPPPLPVSRTLRSTPQSTIPSVTTDGSGHGNCNRYDTSSRSSPDKQFANEGGPQGTTLAPYRSPSRPPSNSNLSDRYNMSSSKTAPPPPAPRSIGKKPPPPPPPAKRPALAARD